MSEAPPLIFVVEDSPHDEALLLRALRQTGLANRIDIARDGAEALDYLFRTGAYAKRGPEMPSVVMLDLKLPKLDGIEVLKAIRQNRDTRTLPVVMLTSSDEGKDVIAAYAAGANSYVRKPVKFDEYVDAVQQLGLYWVLVNETAPRR